MICVTALPPPHAMRTPRARAEKILGYAVSDAVERQSDYVLTGTST